MNKPTKLHWISKREYEGKPFRIALWETHENGGGDVAIIHRIQRGYSLHNKTFKPTTSFHDWDWHLNHRDDNDYPSRRMHGTCQTMEQAKMVALVAYTLTLQPQISVSDAMALFTDEGWIVKPLPTRSSWPPKDEDGLTDQQKHPVIEKPDWSPEPSGPGPGELWFCNRCGKATKSIGEPEYCPHCHRDRAYSGGFRKEEK